jgi:MFS family permease
LLALAGPAWSFAFTSAASAMLVLLVVAMRIPARQLQVGGESMVRQAREGLRFVATNAVVGWLLAMAMVMTVFGFGFFVLLPSLARDVFDSGEGAYGALNSASGAGALAGSLVVVFVSRRQRPRARLLFGGAVCLCLALFGLAASPVLIVAAGALFVVGLTEAVYFTLSNTVILTTAPEDLRGRVMSVQTFIWGLAPIGSLAAGIIADGFGVRTAIAICGAAALAAVVGIYGTRPELRRL